MTSNELETLKKSILDDVRVMMQTTGQVTQYIGARYVPVFADPLEWSDQIEYEPLTVVSHQGNSFTSRQFVPKGVDINDESFWASTGNYNAQIEQYRQEVAAFDVRITEVKNTVDSKAPINHADETTEYGVGNAVNYGHVKLANEDTPLTSDSNNGIAATPNLINNMISSTAFYKSVEDYGVLVENDPETNRTNLQKALDDAAGKNIVLYVPAKTYTISDYVEIGNDTHIVGLSQKNSVIKTTSATNGIFMSKLDTTNNVYITAGSTISNMRLIGNYWVSNTIHTLNDITPYTPSYTLSPTKRCVNAGMSIMSVGSTIEKLTIQGFFVGLHTYTMPVPNNSLEETYLTYYGDVRTFSKISVHHCYTAIELREIDTLATDLRLYNCYSLGTSDSTIIYLHAWIWVVGLTVGGSMSNAEIEGQENIAPSDKPVKKWGPWLYLYPGVYNNIKMWHFNHYTPFPDATGTANEYDTIIKLHRGGYTITGLKIAPNIPPEVGAEKYPNDSPLIVKCDSGDAVGFIEGFVGFSNAKSLGFSGTGLVSLLRFYNNDNVYPSAIGWKTTGLPTISTTSPVN